MRLSALFGFFLVFAVATNAATHAPDSSSAIAMQDSASDTPDKPRTPQEMALLRAQIMMARKDYAGAALAYQHLLDQDPRNTDLLNQVGMAYQQLGEVLLAEHFYKKAISADKKSSQAINNLGTLEYGRGHFGKAIKDYKKAVADGGLLAPVYSNLGYAYCAIKLYPQAMTAFGRALALDPTIFEPKGNAGSIIQQRTAVDKGALYFLVAKSYAKMGDAEHTARYLKLARDDGYKDFRAAEKDPDFATVIKDEHVQEILRVQPAYAGAQVKPVSN
jgi:tetratricopeptide (TPR) repeat protein